MPHDRRIEDDSLLAGKVRCVDCKGEMSPEDRLAGLWFIDRWCIECVEAEDERSLEQDTYPDSDVTFRVPRYLVAEEEWREEVKFDELDKMYLDMISNKKKESEGNG